MAECQKNFPTSTRMFFCPIVGCSYRIKIEVLRRLFFEPGFTESAHTSHVAGSFVRQLTRGTPSDVPVPRNMISLFRSVRGRSPKTEILISLSAVVVKRNYQFCGELIVISSLVEHRLECNIA